MNLNTSIESSNLINSKKLFTYKEQEHIRDSDRELFQKLDLKFEPTSYEGIPKYLGISNEWTSYYIGASWLTKDRAIVVTPKSIKDDDDLETDFIEIYIQALKFLPSAEYFSKFYAIDFEQPQIETDSLSEQLTPLLIIHFISCLQKITEHGLRKGYIIKEENLHSKVKGRIIIQKNLKKNIFTQRHDRIFCRFQEYTVDIPENRLLKKALKFSASYLDKLISLNYHEEIGQIKQKINSIATAFYQVSDSIEVYEIKTFRKNKLFYEYSEAIKVAKMILRFFDYSISKTGSCFTSVPPFWIDMSRLFEIYVYSKLQEAYGQVIKFQVPGRLGSVADFIKTDEKLIIDAKYKTKYQKTNSAILADIRELSGYSRDDRILRTMGVKKTVIQETEPIIPCIIIYPEYQKLEIDKIMDEEEKKEIEEYNKTDSSKTIVFDKPMLQLVEGHDIPGFRKFYKLFVELPVKK